MNRCKGSSPRYKSRSGAAGYIRRAVKAKRPGAKRLIVIKIGKTYRICRRGCVGKAR